eukprot:3653888-Rhodomonas_salina.1
MGRAQKGDEKAQGRVQSSEERREKQNGRKLKRRGKLWSCSDGSDTNLACVYQSQHLGDAQQIESMAHGLNSARYPLGIAMVMVDGTGTPLVPVAHPDNMEWPPACQWTLFWTLVPLDPFPVGREGYFDPRNCEMRPAYVRVAAQLPNRILEVRVRQLEPGGTRHTPSQQRGRRRWRGRRRSRRRCRR